MKIGVLTFHWGANHGAMLQSFATAGYLQSKNAEVKVIDYYPVNQELSLKNALRLSHPQVMLDKISAYKKEKQVAPFRKKLPLTKRYYTNQQLIDNPPDFDVLVTGSDQVWNPYFIQHGEGTNKTSPVYFLNFGKEDCKKVALSVSFGCSEYPETATKIAKPLIEDFDAISVREKTGLKILENMGIDGAVITADPTSLLKKDDILELCKEIPESSSAYTAKCILRKQSDETLSVINSLISACNNKNTVDIEKISMENWLAGIRDAKFVVTNSFHCIMMCLKLHTPFAAVTESGAKAGMNDRLFTLLDRFGLADCIVADKNADFAGITSKIIDWDSVDKEMEKYADSLVKYLDSSIFGVENNE